MATIAMIVFYVLCLLFATQAGFALSDGCEGTKKAKDRDGVSCYECGHSSLPITTDMNKLTMGKEPASLGNFPWFTALYINRTNEWDYICGGTLVSSRVVITGAHCVMRRSRSSRVVSHDPQQFMVVLGNTNRQWNITLESEIRRQVKEILVHPNYIGQTTAYSYDIALLLLESKVPFSSFVMPACLDYHLSQSLPQNSDIGYVSGFGLQGECPLRICTSFPETLHFSSTRIQGFVECLIEAQNIIHSVFSMLTADKFCIGNGTVSPTQKGDGGSGLTVIRKGLHYLTGVASVKFINLRGGKAHYSYGTMTNVTALMDWIKPNLPEED